MNPPSLICAISAVSPEISGDNRYAGQPGENEGNVAWVSKIASNIGRWKEQFRPSTAKAAFDGNQIEAVWIGSRLMEPPNSIEEFYQAYFDGQEEPRLVVQVGANDGIMCDPLRRYLVRSRDQNIKAVLIEPIPFYFDRLRRLYADYPNITLLNVACGATKGSASLYFIDPRVADKMNGSGPPNNWAHGQGSFDKGVVEYWIERNRFRGDDYVKDLEFFRASIKSIQVPVVPLADLDILQRPHENTLVAIDVQGSEKDVIEGIDWSHPPAYIVFEDDLNKAGPINQYLMSKGYMHLCGNKEKLYTSKFTVRA